VAELKTRILVVDDDQRLRDLLVRYLGNEGYEVKAVAEASGMDKQLARERYDLIVLDLMLPGEDGLAICRRLRGQNNAPAIIMLTAKGDDVDRIVGLEMGADDYLPKPFNPRELSARIDAVLRRSRPQSAIEWRAGDPFSVGDVSVDKGARVARRGDQALDLTTVEFDLLDLLLRGAGRVIPRDELVQNVLRREFSPFDRSIDTHVSNLRRKLGPAPDGTERIKGVRGIGYQYALHERTPSLER
jgi:DNA-binding response OmpR family regulator